MTIIHYNVKLITETFYELRKKSQRKRVFNIFDQLKIKNLTSILLYLFSYRKATKTQLVRGTALSNSTVSASVNSLVKLGLVESDGLEESIGGRRSSIYRINKNYGRFIGVDIRENELRYAVTDCQNALIETGVCKLKSQVPAVQQLLDCLERVIAAHTKVLGIGIGLDAQLDPAEQVVLHSGRLGWDNVHLKEVIERRFLILTYIDHRVNGAGVREGILGNMQGFANYVCFYESAPEKAALVLNGEICRGARNSIGRLTAEPALWEALPSLLNFLDVNAVCIGYRTKEYKEKMLALANRTDIKVFCFPEAEPCMEAGMATVAQKEWFQSIYFML